MQNHTDIEEELAAAYRDGFLTPRVPIAAKQTWLEVARKLLGRNHCDLRGPALLVPGPDRVGKIPLDDGEVIVGRCESCSVCLPYRFVSRRHGRVIPSAGQWLYQDLGSANGTLINGVRCMQRLLVGGDILQIGEATIVFLAGRADLHEEANE